MKKGLACSRPLADHQWCSWVIEIGGCAFEGQQDLKLTMVVVHAGGDMGALRTRLALSLVQHHAIG